jgi:hypothetical protein
VSVAPQNADIPGALQRPLSTPSRFAQVTPNPLPLAHCFSHVGKRQRLSPQPLASPRFPKEDTTLKDLREPPAPVARPQDIGCIRTASVRSNTRVAGLGASASVKGYLRSAVFAMGKVALRGLARSMARALRHLRPLFKSGRPRSLKLPDSCLGNIGPNRCRGHLRPRTKCQREDCP